jgi:hypothetical protein
MPDEMPTAEAPYFVMIDYGYEGWRFVGTAKTLQELASVYERGTLTGGGACSPLLVGRLVALRFVDSPDVGVQP